MCVYYVQVSTDHDNTLIIAPPVFYSPTRAVYTISQLDHVISEPSSPKLNTIVHFISSLTGQSSVLSVLSTSHTPDCVSQSDHSVSDSNSPSAATPPSQLHKVPLVHQLSAILGEELIVVIVTGLVVLVGFVAVCCSLWRHGNTGSSNQTGFSFHIPSADSSTPQSLPPILMSSSNTPPGSSPQQLQFRGGSAFTPTNNSSHCTL